MPDQNCSPYDPAAHPNFAVAVDVALFTIRNRAVHIALVQRGEGSFEGRGRCGRLRAGARGSRSGGRTPIDGRDRSAARRQLVSGTTRWIRLSRAGSACERRHVCLSRDLRGNRRAQSGSDWDSPWVTPVQAKKWGLLSFDHARIVRDALARIRSNLEGTTLATMFLPPAFTIGDLREVYEAVWDTPLDRANFRRNFRRNETCFVESEAPPAERIRRPGRPSQQWWSLRSPRPNGEPVGLLDHPLLGPREAWRQRRYHAVNDG